MSADGLQQSPSAILDMAYQRALTAPEAYTIHIEQDKDRLRAICGYENNRAPARLLLACCLAKTHNPNVDIRKPYTELGDGSYSGRAYDESYVTGFIYATNLPCNPTTAFLTPALRTKPIILERGTELGGRPRSLYISAIHLLNRVQEASYEAYQLLEDTIRHLLVVKQERDARLKSLLSNLQREDGEIPLSSEDIIALVEGHLRIPGASRLPVLVIAAVYMVIREIIGEELRPLLAYNAADQQTGALGDIEITLQNSETVVTTYEIKLKKVLQSDVDRALQKLLNASVKIDNYLFVTTEVPDEEVLTYARSLYAETGGVEFAILDCIQFLRHFLHLFHRYREDFLNRYQTLVLGEPESAVRQPLKEAFLALRRAAESSYLTE